MSEVFGKNLLPLSRSLDERNENFRPGGTDDESPLSVLVYVKRNVCSLRPTECLIMGVSLTVVTDWIVTTILEGIEHDFLLVLYTRLLRFLCLGVKNDPLTWYDSVLCFFFFHCFVGIDFIFKLTRKL